MAAKHKAIIAAELIGIDNAATPDGLGGKANQGLGGDIRDDIDMNLAVSLQDPEYRHFTGCATASLAFASAPNIAFIQFDFTTRQVAGILGRHPFNIGART